METTQITTTTEGFYPGRDRDVSIMADALRLGTLEAKAGLTEALRVAKAAFEEALKKRQAAGVALRASLYHDAVASIDADQALMLLIKLLNKMQAHGPPISPKDVRDELRILDGYVLTPDTHKAFHYVDDAYAATAALYRERKCMCVTFLPMYEFHSSGCQASEIPFKFWIYLSDGSRAAASKLAAANSVVAAASKLKDEAETRLSNLPSTMGQVEAGILRARLSSDDRSASALQLVNAAITQVLGGDMTKLLP